MLLNLTVKNFALIRELCYEPGKGFNVVTGETGAGKSILLGALGLVLGNRAESGVLLNAEQKCIVEATFNIEALQLHDFFQQEELDYEPTTLLRREISPQGKSRAFINDTPVSLNTLRALGSQLIEIHTQNTGLLITQADEQLQLLDDYAMHPDLLGEYKLAWKNWRMAKEQLTHALQVREQLNRERDYLHFQYQELDDFQPIMDEESTLLQQIQLLENAGEIGEACQDVQFQLTEKELSVSDILGQLRQRLRNAARHLPAIEEITQRLESSLEELRDCSLELGKIAAEAESDPNRLEQLNGRYARLQQLLKKHGAEQGSELIQIKNALSEKLQQSDMADHAVEKADELVKHTRNLLGSVAGKLHLSRVKAAQNLASEAVLLLKKLEMPAARLEIQLSELPEPGPVGADGIDILFSANEGKALQPLEKVASGGEVSRLNFCFKALLAACKNCPTLIYDEADTGISGAVADRMGQMMRELGQKHQIISITHLPQVAALGEYHHFVYKSTADGETESRIRLVSGDERVRIVAEMLSGRQPGEAAIANARELLAAQ
ncbi:MAG: DNA repair protein RecN [Bacteroidetes bacterium]|nr:DNA repair protein RecN [Bacteroidota bacterium]